MRTVFIIIAVFFIANTAWSQEPPCYPDYYGLTNESNTLTTSPPYSIYMPYEVLVGYIAFDSLTHYSYRDDQLEFLKRQTWNDTIKYIMRFFYETIDYDPVLFFQTEKHPDRYSCHPGEIGYMISKIVEDISPYGTMDALLLESDIIAHIRATDTLRREMPDDIDYASIIAIATADIIELLKGNNIPPCKDVSLSSPNLIEKQKVAETLDQDTCVQFEYRLGWNRAGGSDLRMVDTAGAQWIKPNQEYLVFLNFVLICSGNGKYYYTTLPALKTMTFSMYPIYDDRVYDPDNDFGLGNGVDIDVLKSALKARITEIKEYDGE